MQQGEWDAKRQVKPAERIPHRYTSLLNTSSPPSYLYCRLWDRYVNRYTCKWSQKNILCFPDKLFTCKLGGRKPTHSDKSSTHSRHSPKWVNRLVFVILWPVQQSLKLLTPDSYFEAKMHQVRFSSRSAPDPLARFKGSICKGKEGKAREGEGRGEIKKGKDRGKNGVIHSLFSA